MTKEGLRSLIYDGIPIEVCEAAYETIHSKGYKTILLKTSDLPFLEWMSLSGIHQTKTNAVFGFIDNTNENPLLFIPHIKKEIAFYGISPQILRAYFNQPAHYDQWMTLEIPIGDGLFIAKRV